MNPHEQCCPNKTCEARGKIGEGNIWCHSKQDHRYKCKVCGKTFTATTGTPLYRLKTSPELFVVVVTLLAFGCPVKAVVMAMGLDARTVRAWGSKAGEHCEDIHEHLVGNAQLDLGHVQADEIKVKTRGGSIWMAMAMMVSTRLWLGGVVSPKREKHLIRALADKVRQVALCRDVLLAVDGLSSYIDAFRKAFRSPLPTGKVGRPRLITWQGIHIVQVVKQRRHGVLTIQRRIVQGTQDGVARLLTRSRGGVIINTAYIERLNATFRQRLACLTRRTRHLAHRQTTLHHSMMVLGTVYNFCTSHHSLRLPLWITPHQRRWVNRTPAMAAGLTDHCWSVNELMTFKVPPPPFVPPKRRGRPPKVAS